MCLGESAVEKEIKSVEGRWGQWWMMVPEGSRVVGSQHQGGVISDRKQRMFNFREKVQAAEDCVAPGKFLSGLCTL